LCTLIASRTARWEFGQEDRRPDECHHVGQITDDKGPAAAEMVDQDNAEEFAEECDDRVDGLVTEGIGTGDAYFGLSVC
jgi:hypothetical protein